MGWWEALALAALQALTEFLPVSSSGHLLVASELLGVQLDGAQREAVFVWLHLASLLAMVVGLLRASRRATATSEEPISLAAIFVVCVPAGVVGLSLRLSGAESLFEHVWLAGLGWLVTAALLSLTRRRRSDRLWLAAPRPLPVLPLLMVGLLQALALLPGISRSGATISGALLVGLAPGTAFRLSFLAVLPLILGAQALEAREAVDVLAHVRWEILLVAFGACFVGSLFAFEALRRMVASGRLHWFAPYCLLLGLATLALSFR